MSLSLCLDTLGFRVPVCHFPGRLALRRGFNRPLRGFGSATWHSSALFLPVLEHSQAPAR